jgi:hypothetical protein
MASERDCPHAGEQREVIVRVIPPADPLPVDAIEPAVTAFNRSLPGCWTWHFHDFSIIVVFL